MEHASAGALSALQPHQIRLLALDDVDLGAGTLRTGGRTRRLDALTRTELRARVEARRARWPASANPYLLVSQRTANGCSPVTRGFVQQVFRRLGLTAGDLRVDRLLAEIHDSGGDPLTLTGLAITGVRRTHRRQPAPTPSVIRN